MVIVSLIVISSVQVDAEFTTEISFFCVCVTLLGVADDHELLTDISTPAYRDEQLTNVLLYIIHRWGYEHCWFCMQGKKTNINNWYHYCDKRVNIIWPDYFILVSSDLQYKETVYGWSAVRQIECDKLNVCWIYQIICDIIHITNLQYMGL